MQSIVIKNNNFNAGYVTNTYHEAFIPQVFISSFFVLVLWFHWMLYLFRFTATHINLERTNKLSESITNDNQPRTHL